jgi:hypothetical protein
VKPFEYNTSTESRETDSKNSVLKASKPSESVNSRKFLKEMKKAGIGQQRAPLPDFCIMMVMIMTFF